jgi:hypothetical protein
MFLDVKINVWSRVLKMKFIACTDQTPLLAQIKLHCLHRSNSIACTDQTPSLAQIKLHRLHRSNSIACTVCFHLGIHKNYSQTHKPMILPVESCCGSTQGEGKKKERRQCKYYCRNGLGKDVTCGELLRLNPGKERIKSTQTV